jgi:putative NADH-flavin reductase
VRPRRRCARCRPRRLSTVRSSPAALLEPGQRTGRFRLGGDQLLTDEQGQSRISVQDYAVAMIDELERSAHSRQRFSVAH